MAKAGLPAEFGERLSALGTTLSEARLAVLNELARRDAAMPPVRAHHSAGIVRDERDTLLAAMQDGLFARVTGRAPSDAGREWFGRRTADLARELLAYRGVRVTGDARAVEVALMHTTGDFPALLANAANRVLLDAFTAAEAVLKRIGRRAVAMDFKERSVLRRGEFPAFEEVPEAAEYKQGTIGERKETYSIRTFGRIFSISRVALVNDDLSALSDWAAAIGSAAASFEASYLVDLLTRNGDGQVLSDGQPLFHSSRSNTGTGAISVEGLAQGFARMRRQKGLDGSTIVGAAPRYLIVPAELEAKARQYVAENTPAAADDVNPFSTALEVLVEPRLDDVSAAQWYLASEPSVLPALEYSYLDGATGPTVEYKQGFEIDGLQVKARLDFGASFIDFRAVYRSSGS